MPSVNDPQPTTRTGQQYWRSLDELADTPEFREFLHDEFPGGVSDEMLNGNGATRRHFLKIMGASFALAGVSMTGCRRWPEEKIAPYTDRPEGRTPGDPVAYATSIERAGVSFGVLVTSYDGRPLKIEGNPNHPYSLGAADAQTQASILDLYDPDRSRDVMHGQQAARWDAFVDWAGNTSFGTGDGFYVLSEATHSPSVLALRDRLQRAYPRMTWVEYEPISDGAAIAGAKQAFGEPVRLDYHFDQAKVIVSLDEDFLGVHPASMKYTRDFAVGRRIENPDHAEMNRLYVFEPGVSLTGANADHHVPVQRSDMAVIAAKIAVKLLDHPDQALQDLASRAVSGNAELDAMLDRVVVDLQANSGGEAIVTAGSSQPAEVHVLVAAINAAIGAFGRTVTAVRLPDASSDQLGSLVDDMNAGRVSTLFILGGNPVFNAPADLKFAEALTRVGESIHLSLYQDETSSVCSWHVHRAHALECWGDGRAWDGTVSVSQPLILPLHGGHSAVEVLAVLAGGEPDGEAIVKQTCRSLNGGSMSDDQWRTALHDGVLAGSAWPKVTLSFRHVALVGAVGTLLDQSAGSGMELVFQADPTVFDGRYANNGWLQELPDPLTKLTWDNAVLLSVSKAKELDVKTGDVVQITGAGVELDAPVLIMPGHHDESASLNLGYGRSFDGRICSGAGFDAYPFRSTDAMWSLSGVSISKTGRKYKLATTQDHHAIDVEKIGGRGQQERLPALFREASLDEYKKHPDFAAHRTHVPHKLSMWDETNLEGADHRWAMSIDLSACTGCSACVTACQAENNIPIVGKDEVSRGREMHWIRLDRYFQFARNDNEYDAEDLDGIALQPVLCMMCENAPCEQVCPVSATNHDRDGLNVMVYNRCIGTRYCSSNCPYKVRRFNFFDYHRKSLHRERPGLLAVDSDYYKKGQAEPTPLQQMQFNPEVTVRMRGVMEKCTFCLQRITDAKISQKNEWVENQASDRDNTADDHGDTRVPDGSFQTACQQTCPAQAIVFGDLNDPDSAVSRLHKNSRSYGMLEELNVKPRVKYLAKVTNPADSTSHGSADHAEAGGEGTDH